MKKNFLLTVFVFLMLFGRGFSQELNCKSLHTGSFKVTTKETGTTYISRTEKQQTEKNETLGYEVVFAVKWTDDCTYELRPMKLVKGDPAIMGNGSSFIRMKIKKILKASYIVEASSNFNNLQMDLVVERLE